MPLAVLHFAQAIAVVALSTGFVIAVTSSVPAGPPGTAVPASKTIFDVPIGWAIARHQPLPLDRILVQRHVMVILIGFYSGITSINTILAVAGANVGMILFGWLQERMNPPGRTSTTMLPCWFGTVVGLAPWASIAFNVLGAKTVPGFVYGIVISQAVLFFSFGLNQWLQ